jgi:hypothetical protein
MNSLTDCLASFGDEFYLMSHNTECYARKRCTLKSAVNCTSGP